MAENPLTNGSLSSLPIFPFLSEISSALKSSESHFLVLTAETAAGKSTALPPALLQSFPGKILMLEPRRLATLAVASRVAELLGEKCGETSGYRMRLETKVSSATRFEVLTEAILIRMLQNDPSLEGVSVVILDEFHERSLYADLSLAFLKEAVNLRDDLYVLVMSATIDTKALSAFLDCPVFQVPGRQFPVEIEYRPPALQPHQTQNADFIAKSVADAVYDELQDSAQTGNIFAFLPGIAELRRAEACLTEKLGGASNGSFFALLDAAANGSCSSLSGGISNGSDFSFTGGSANGSFSSSTGRFENASFSSLAGGSQNESNSVLPDRATNAKNPASQSASANASFSALTGGSAKGSFASSTGRFENADGSSLTGAPSSRSPYAGNPASQAAKTEIHILHSSIPFSEQQKIFAKTTDTRRVILSSAVAETSLTVPGVTTVIDSGLSRFYRLNATTGMNRLVTEPSSVFSAEQRAGRAGRTSAGKCIRLWSKNEVRPLFTPPEIQTADLMSLVLECALWGIRTPEKLEWLDSPPAGAWQSAKERLTLLGCLGSGGEISPKGKAVLKLGVSPRIACLALESLGGNEDALKLAAFYSVEGKNQSKTEEARILKDLSYRLSAFKSDKDAALLYSGLKGSLCMLAGFPDRLAKLCADDEGLYQFPSGRKAAFTKAQKESMSAADFAEWIIAPEVDAGETTGKIYSWQPVIKAEMPALDEWLKAHSVTFEKASFEKQKKPGAETGKEPRVLRKSEYTAFGKIILKERRLTPEPEDITGAWINLVKTDGIRALPWYETCENFLLRAEFYLKHKNESANADDTAKTAETLLTESAEEWLPAFIPQKGSPDAGTILDAIRWKLDGTEIDRNVPQKIKLDNGKERRISYEIISREEGVVPVLEIIIQQMFGCFETPRIMGVPVLLKLLSPARRPLQITQDLSGFWKNTWPEICREMKGRYPKHNWDYTKFLED